MTAALERGEWSAPASLCPRERPGTHCTIGWVGPRSGLDGRKISSPPEFDPEPSSRSQTLYRLGYPAHTSYIYIYRVFHKSLQDFRTRLRNNQDRHGRKEHINRERERERERHSKFGEILYLLICSFLPCLSWLLRSRVRKSRRDL